MMRPLYSTFFIFLLVFNARGKASENVTVNDVFQAIFHVKKSAVVTSVNQRLKKKNFHKGTFFKGEIPLLRTEVDAIVKSSPRVVASPMGFIAVAGRGKHEVKVELEFVDILTGRVRVDGKDVQLRENMTYLEAAQALAAPPLKRVSSKKNVPIKETSSFSLSSFFISGAMAQESTEQSRAKQGSVLSQIANGNTEDSAIARFVLLLLLPVDIVMTEIQLLLSSDDNIQIDKVKNELEGMLALCVSSPSVSNSTTSSSDLNSLEQVALSLEARRTEEGLTFIDCRKDIVGVENLSQTAVSGVFNPLSYSKRVLPLCGIYKDIVKCLENKPAISDLNTRRNPRPQTPVSKGITGEEVLSC